MIERKWIKWEELEKKLHLEGRYKDKDKDDEVERLIEKLKAVEM